MSYWEYSETELWRHGEKGVALFHVFGLLTVQNNVVLAFAEARYGNGGDAGTPHDIWMRKSLDGGKTFGESTCLIEGKSKHCWTNPVPLYDKNTQRLFLFYSDNIENTQSENLLITSDDLGKSWSEPQRINPFLETGADPPPFHLAGPGHGIQLRSGHLVVPFWHRKYGTEKPAHQRGYCISALYSDDHGHTWHHSTYIGQKCMANESRIVETNSDLLWIIRGGNNNPCRYESRSLDGGITWSEPIPQASGAANNCDAGGVAVVGKEGYQNMVLLSRISTLSLRRDMEILLSLDGGKTFPHLMALPPGDAMPGYSDLCVITEEEPVVGLLHCRNNHVLFSRISLQSLTGGQYENTRRSVWL